MIKLILLATFCLIGNAMPQVQDTTINICDVTTQVGIAVSLLVQTDNALVQTLQRRTDSSSFEVWANFRLLVNYYYHYTNHTKTKNTNK